MGFWDSFREALGGGRKKSSAPSGRPGGSAGPGGAQRGNSGTSNRQDNRPGTSETSRSGGGGVIGAIDRGLDSVHRSLGYETQEEARQAGRDRIAYQASRESSSTVLASPTPKAEPKPEPKAEPEVETTASKPEEPYVAPTSNPNTDAANTATITPEEAKAKTNALRSEIPQTQPVKQPAPITQARPANTTSDAIPTGRRNQGSVLGGVHTSASGLDQSAEDRRRRTLLGTRGGLGN